MIKIIELDGMSCQNCVRHVKDALLEIENVSTAQVNLDNKTATIEYEGKVENSLLDEIINDLGYRITSIKES